MASLNIFDQTDDRQQPTASTPATQGPAAHSAPNPWQSVGAAMGGTQQQPSLGQQTDRGWIYPWRSDPYQSQLGPHEVEQQKQEYAFRNAHPGVKLNEDSAGLMQTIAAAQSGQWSPTGGAGRTQLNMGQMPGFQFDDPYTKQLEDMIRQNLSSIQQPQSNPALDQLNQFLSKRFTELSESPGYSPEDLAIMRTQMLEPIERDRQANRDRVTQRTAARGMLPSSGLHEQDLQEFVDRPAMEQRTAAQRDLAINAIGQRRQDLNQAVNVGRVSGIEIPGLQRAEDQGRRAEALNLSTLLYDLPNRAMQQAQSVISGSPGPQDLFSQAIQLQQVQQQQQAMNAQKWATIAQIAAEMFG